MPPIPIYAHSPINAAKADGVTPKTAEQGHSQNANPPPTTTATTTQPIPPRPAQPGAAPAMPAPTGAVSAQHMYSPPPPQPTRTQPLESHGPPPPQPGAFPLAPGSSSGHPPPGSATSTGLPPPPKAGEAPATSTYQYPPQLSMAAPASSIATQGAQRGTMTSSATAFGAAAAPSPLEHPPGYQQNPNAGELNQYQRAAQEALDREEEERRRRVGGGGAAGGVMAGLDGEGGVWGSVKGAMAAAGEKIAAAEEGVWKRINKDL